MMNKIVFAVLGACLAIGCSEHIDVNEPEPSPPIDIVISDDLSGRWERSEYFVDTTWIVVQDTLTYYETVEGRLITRLELADDRFTAAFYNGSVGEDRLIQRREGELTLSGDTLEARVYSLFPRLLLRQTITRFRLKGDRLMMTLIYDSAEPWINRYEPAREADSIFVGGGLFWLREAPEGDFGDRSVRELGTFHRLD